MKKVTALQSALRNSGAAKPAASPPPPANDRQKPARSQVAEAVKTGKPVQASRVGTSPITVHYPEEVKRQLKSMAGDLGRNMDDIVAEGLNLVFALHKRPEIAPRKPTKK